MHGDGLVNQTSLSPLQTARAMGANVNLVFNFSLIYQEDKVYSKRTNFTVGFFMYVCIGQVPGVVRDCYISQTIHSVHVCLSAFII